MGSLGMLFYVVECFPVNLENLATDAVRSAQLGRVDEQIEGNRGFISVPFRESTHQVHEVRALNAEGPEVRNGLAELGTLVLDGLLEVGDAAGGLFRGGRKTAAQYVELNLDAEERLEDSVVEIAGNPAAFRFDGASAQVPQKKDVFKGGTDVRGDAFKPG
jgi:hypothetical protein